MKLQRIAGFTLVELMVVIVIIGILTTIAYPSYTDYLRRTARAEAKATLMENAQYLERYFTTNGAYTGGTLTTSVSPKNSSGSAVRYNLSFSLIPNSIEFVIQAVPANAQAIDNCGTLTINQAGLTTAAATTGCW